MRKILFIYIYKYINRICIKYRSQLNKEPVIFQETLNNKNEESFFIKSNSHNQNKVKEAPAIITSNSGNENKIKEIPSLTTNSDKKKLSPSYQLIPLLLQFQRFQNHPL